MVSLLSNCRQNKRQEKKEQMPWLPINFILLSPLILSCQSRRITGSRGWEKIYTSHELFFLNQNTTYSLYFIYFSIFPYISVCSFIWEQSNHGSFEWANWSCHRSTAVAPVFNLNCLTLLLLLFHGSLQCPYLFMIHSSHGIIILQGAEVIQHKANMKRKHAKCMR